MFSKSFINRVKEVYPDSARMHELAESGNQFLGRYLDDSISQISYREILDSTSLEELKIKARRIEKQHSLYKDFSNGSCYNENDMRKTMCPNLYLQNNDCDKRGKAQEIICKDVGYVCYFPSCKNWDCKEKCWEKYDNMNIN